MTILQITAVLIISHRLYCVYYSCYQVHINGFKMCAFHVPIERSCQGISDAQSTCPVLPRIPWSLQDADPSLPEHSPRTPFSPSGSLACPPSSLSPSPGHLSSITPNNLQVHRDLGATGAVPGGLHQQRRSPPCPLRYLCFRRPLTGLITPLSCPIHSSSGLHRAWPSGHPGQLSLLIQVVSPSSDWESPHTRDRLPPLNPSI